MTEKLYDLIGTPRFNHAASLVRTGEMLQAIVFFTEQLGWEEDIAAHVKGEWGEARFVHPPQDPSTRVQLTESLDFTGTGALPGAHIGLDVPNAKAAAKATVEWARTVGYEAADEAANALGNKWFVWVGFLAFRIEYITISTT